MIGGDGGEGGSRYLKFQVRLKISGNLLSRHVVAAPSIETGPQPRDRDLPYRTTPRPPSIEEVRNPVVNRYRGLRTDGAGGDKIARPPCRLCAPDTFSIFESLDSSLAYSGSRRVDAPAILGNLDAFSRNFG